MADTGTFPFHSSFRVISEKEAGFRGPDLGERGNERERKRQWVEGGRGRRAQKLKPGIPV